MRRRVIANRKSQIRPIAMNSGRPITARARRAALLKSIAHVVARPPKNVGIFAEIRGFVGNDHRVIRNQRPW